MATKKKLPADTNKRAKFIVDIATSNDPKEEVKSDISLAATTLGRKGGLKGGKARAESLTSERRAEIARKAARARWGNSS